MLPPSVWYFARQGPSTKGTSYLFIRSRSAAAKWCDDSQNDSSKNKHNYADLKTDLRQNPLGNWVRMENCEVQPLKPWRQMIHEFNAGASAFNKVINNNSKQLRIQFCALRNAFI